MAYFKLFRELWRQAGQDRSKIVLLMSFHILSQIGNVFQPLAFAQILNVLQTRPEHLMRHVVYWVLAWIFLQFWFDLFHRMARHYDFTVSTRTRQNVINEYYRISTRLPLQWHTDHHSGETIGRINRAADALKGFVEFQMHYTRYFVQFWGPLIALATLSWEVSVAAFVVAVVTVPVSNHFDNQLRTLFAQANDLQNRTASALFDYIGNIRTVITLRLGRETSRELDSRMEAAAKPFVYANTVIDQNKWFSIGFFVLMLEAGTVLFYVWRRVAVGGIILVGNLSAILQYLQKVTGTLYAVAEQYQQIINWWVDYQAVLPLKEALAEHVPAGTEDAGAWHRIEISGLDFAYSPHKPTLHDVSLSFAPGERIALVGESGSGKSSLMAVLRGLYQPQAARLDIDGKSFDTLAPLAGITTLIPQEPEIFENTIRYNITFGVEHSEAEVLEAIRLARFDPVLERLPQGLDTDVRERGVTLSGGERQRLALARGILAARDSSLILMDEPTSSVDAFNEAAIYDNLFVAFADRVVISSIHRLHLLGRFTHVIVMEQGRVVEAGTFEQLKAGDGPFQTLWKKSVSAEG